MPNMMYRSDLFKGGLRDGIVYALSNSSGSNWRIARSLVGEVGPNSWIDASDMPVVNIRETDRPGFVRGERPSSYFERQEGETRKFVEFRLVKLLRKICPDTYTDKEWAEFGDWLTPRVWPVWNFELLRGSAIRTAYHESSYAYGSGSLSNSCMRYTSCKSFFQLYWKNPDVCALLVSKDANDKINGRALIWTTDDGTVVSDRIYGNDKTISAMKKYISEQGWWLRGEFDGYNWSWVKPDGDVEQRNFRVNVRKCDFQTYPYMDTFRTLDKSGGFISTDPEEGDWSLSSTSGDSSFLGRRSTCSECGGRYRSRNGWMVNGQRTMCRPCGERSTARCVYCDVWQRREDMQRVEGHWYCEAHVPEPCALCQSATPPSRAVERTEHGRVCQPCYNNLYAGETYVTADGHTLTRLEYEGREECGRCHRYWSAFHTYPIPLYWHHGASVSECRECRSARRVREQEDGRNEIRQALSAMQRWRERWGIEGADNAEFRSTCGCNECQDFRASQIEDEATLALTRTPSIRDRMEAMR
jgi:hypothetical protein